MFSSQTDMWEIPQDLFDELNKEFRFNLDACATAQNAKCRSFITEEEDSLTQEWRGRAASIPEPLPIPRPHTVSRVEKERRQLKSCPRVLLLRPYGRPPGHVA